MWELVGMPVYGGQDNLECHSSDTICVYFVVAAFRVVQAGWLADASQRAPKGSIYLCFPSMGLGAHTTTPDLLLVLAWVLGMEPQFLFS